MHDSAINRGRHCRALCFVLVAFASSSCAYLWLGFDQLHTISYAVAAYSVLTALNFRTMFAKRGPVLSEDEDC